MGDEVQTMRKLNSFYNNEMLTGIAILSVLYQIEELEITKALLIQPILSYCDILNLVKKRNVKIRSIEELIVKKNLPFTNFNKRYLESLELSINSILLMKHMNFIKIYDNKLFIGKNIFDLYDSNLGKRAKDLVNGAICISKAIDKGDASNLYLSLRIEL